MFQESTNYFKNFQVEKKLSCSAVINAFIFSQILNSIIFVSLFFSKIIFH